MGNPSSARSQQAWAGTVGHFLRKQNEREPDPENDRIRYYNKANMCDTLILLNLGNNEKLTVYYYKPP